MINQLESISLTLKDRETFEWTNRTQALQQIESLVQQHHVNSRWAGSFYPLFTEKIVPGLLVQVKEYLRLILLYVYTYIYISRSSFYSLSFLFILIDLDIYILL